MDSNLLVRDKYNNTVMLFPFLSCSFLCLQLYSVACLRVFTTKYFSVKDDAHSCEFAIAFVEKDV